MRTVLGALHLLWRQVPRRAGSKTLRRYTTSSHSLAQNDLIALHKQLVEIESISGNEKPVGDWLAGNLQSQGYNVEKQYLPGDKSRFNVLAWPGDRRDASVMLSSRECGAY